MDLKKLKRREREKMKIAFVYNLIESYTEKEHLISIKYLLQPTKYAHTFIQIQIIAHIYTYVH